MTLQATTGAGGTNAVAYTAATAGVSVLQGNALIGSNATPLVPPLSFLTDTSAVFEMLEFDYATSKTSATAQLIFRLNTLPNVACDLLSIRGSGGQACKMQLTAANKIAVFDATVSIRTSTAVLTAGHWYRAELSGTLGVGTTGSIKSDFYDGESNATPVEAGVSTTGTSNTGTSTVVTAIRGGKCTNVVAGITFGKFAANDGTALYIGPLATANQGTAVGGLSWSGAAAGVAPAVGVMQGVAAGTINWDDNAIGLRPANVTVEPFTVYDLGTGSRVQTSGPIVTLTGSTFVAPALPASSNRVIVFADQATINVLPHTLFRAVGGVWAPIRYASNLTGL